MCRIGSLFSALFPKVNNIGFASSFRCDNTTIRFGNYSYHEKKAGKLQLSDNIYFTFREEEYSGK